MLQKMCWLDQQGGLLALQAQFVLITSRSSTTDS